MIILLIITIISIYYICSKIEEKFTNTKDKIIYGLKIIDMLFNKHNIYYTVAYGTLLGTIRHWDMIPWDDDGDINVWRKDYNKIIKLKEEFKENGLIMVEEWKLIKIYFNDTKYPFIDIFINEDNNGKVIRCMQPYNKGCNSIDRINKWWWKWLEYPTEWIDKRRRYRFGEIEIWGPKSAERVLKYWYGEKCLVECKTAELNHISGQIIKQENVECKNLPKNQL